MTDFFHHVARRIAERSGSAWAFLAAVAAIAVWAMTGPLFHFSDTWQLVINTGTTIVTFLMVFLIQHTQNHDSLAMQLKLDELLRSVTKARTSLVNLEDLTEEELEHLHEQFRQIQQRTNRPGQAE